MKFTTVDSLLIVEGNYLEIKDFPKRNVNIFYAGIFIFFLYLFLKRVMKMQFNAVWNWLVLLLFGTCMLFYGTMLMSVLFKKKWPTEVDISEIEKINAENLKRNNIQLVLKNSLKSRFQFSSLKDAEQFIFELRKVNSEIEIQNAASPVS